MDVLGLDRTGNAFWGVVHHGATGGGDLSSLGCKKGRVVAEGIQLEDIDLGAGAKIVDAG